MDAREILRRIDEGANYFLRTLAQGPHMSVTDGGGFTVIQPKPGQEGISFVCELQLDERSPAEWTDLIARAKSTGLPVWFPLLCTDAQFACFFGRERIHGAPLSPEDEVYLAMLPGEIADLPQTHAVHRVTDAASFADCATVINTVLSGGRPDLHPVHHLPLLEAGRIHCHVLYAEGKAVSAAVTMAKDGIASLELVATLPDFRRRGCARAVCRQAVQDEWARGASLVTVRAVNANAARLYEQLGFRPYNHAL